MNSYLLQLLSQFDLAPLPKTPTGQGEIDRIMTVVYVIAGSVALLVLVIGGYRYVLSNGDPSKVAQAKNTIIYGIVGLIVVIVSFSIIAFVLGMA